MFPSTLCIALRMHEHLPCPDTAHLLGDRTEQASIAAVKDVLRQLVCQHQYFMLVTLKLVMPNYAK